ncbi:MAG: CBS domain-containing protein [Candidatus Micrarchaeota archaeon]
MIFTPLSEVRALRRKLGLTQHQLAKACGLSQSFIAKVECGALEPAYGKAVRLFEALEKCGRQREVSAGEVMSRQVVSLSPGARLREAVRKFRERDISQLPVIEGGHPVGVVSEADVLAALLEGKQSATVREVMEEAPPIVPLAASIIAVSSLLRYCPLVLVAEKGRVLGVISRADLLEPLYGK